MPKLTMFYYRSDFEPTVVPYSGTRLNPFLERLKPELKVIVATACSIKEGEFLPAQVNVRFMELHHASDGGPASFELETYGKPALKKKFGTAVEPTDVIMGLRNALVMTIRTTWTHGASRYVMEGFAFLEDPLNEILQVKWIDPDGLYV